MGIGLAIGIVFDLGGILGQAEGDNGGDGASDGGGGGGGFISHIADTVGGVVDRRGMIRVPWKNIPLAMKFLLSGSLMLPLMAHAAETTERSFGSRIALYVGPVFDIGRLYLTAGACLGGFGCAAGGGGIYLGPIGLGVLFPFWKWWWHSFFSTQKKCRMIRHFFHICRIRGKWVRIDYSLFIIW